MFDTFDLLVPKLLPVPGLDIRQGKSAFGLDDERDVYMRDVKLGRAMLASEAFSAVEAWTGAPGRESWTVVLLSKEANTAAKQDGTWEAYLKALATLLRSHPLWRVTCESDCDQDLLERRMLTPDALVALLDRYRESRHPVAFYAEFAAPDT